MQQAAVYVLKNKQKILIHSLSRVKMGASIGTAPFIWLEINASKKEVMQQILIALNESKSDLPNPNNWNENLRMYLNEAGLKSQKDLYQNVISVGVTKKENNIQFTPMINMGAKGFMNKGQEIILLSDNESLENLAFALDEALRKSE